MFVLSVVKCYMEFLVDVHMKSENYQKQLKDLTVHTVVTYVQAVLVKFSKTRLENNDNYYRRIGWNWNNYNCCGSLREVEYSIHLCRFCF